MEKPLIEIEDLHVEFDGKVVLDKISVDVDLGEMVVLLGKNGSGKSVFLKAIAGLIDRYRGDVLINGQDIDVFFKNRNAGRDSGEGISLAYVFQKGGLFDSMNVFDNIAFGLVRRGVEGSEIERIVLSSLERVGLKGSDRKLPSELSGGMQKRVGLARAICLNPSIILYDDPTAGLDPILTDSIADLLLEIRETYETTSIVVTHDLKFARKIADKILLLYGGKIVFSGTGSEFFSERDIYSKQFIEGDAEGPIDIF